MSKSIIDARAHEILSIFPSTPTKSFHKPFYSQTLEKDDTEAEKIFYSNENILGRSIYTSRHLKLAEIQVTIQNLLAPIYEKLDSFVLDNLVDHCYQLFITNIPSLKDEMNLKGSITYLTAEYIKNNNIVKIEINDLEYLGNQIFDNQIIPLISSLVIEYKIELTNREQKYLESRGANLDFNKVLEEAQRSVQEDNKDSYKQDISLSSNGKYSLPIIKCLISFEPESVFIQRLKNPVLQEFLGEYKDHINRTVLHYAVAKGKEKIVKELCKINQVKKLIDSGDGYGRTALHVASSEGYSTIIEELLKNGAALDAKDGYDRTALHLAALNNQVEIIQQLKSSGLEVSVRDNFGRSPLHLAALFNNIAAINKLLEIGANQEEMDGYNRTPLHLAASNNNIDAVGKLLEVGANPRAIDTYNRTAMHLAIKNDAVETIKKFLEHDVNMMIIDNRMNTLLHLATKYNSINTLEFLCSNKELNVNVQNEYGSTPLHNAAFNGDTTAISILLKSGADITVQDSDGRIPLYLTIKRNDELIEVFGIEEASIRKIHAAAKCIDYDYSMFTRKTWNSRSVFSDIALKNLPEIAEKYGYTLDIKVYNFVSKVYQFLNENFEPIPHEKQDHIPLIIKIVESKNVALLEKFINDLPEFKHILDQEQRDNLLIKVLNNNELLNHINLFVDITDTGIVSQTKKFFKEKDQYHTTEICSMLEIQEFNKIREALSLLETNNINLLNKIGLFMCNSTYRELYDITSDAAKIIFGEARDQLELLGADITEIINNYNID